MGVTSRLADWALMLDVTESGDVQELSWPLRFTPTGVDVDWNLEMRRHGQRVVVSLLARGVRAARAKELAQEAWLRVIQRHREGRLSELKLPGVVIAQANFLLLDERRRSEERYRLEPWGEEDAAPTGGGFEQQVLAREQLRTIQAVLDRAHPNAKRVFFSMFGGEPKSAQEIGEELGLSTQRVRQIVCELRQRIRLALEGSADRVP